MPTTPIENEISNTTLKHQKCLRLADNAWEDVRAEIGRAIQKFPAFNSPHEGYAVILEELDELFEAIRANERQQARAEAVQVAAMAIRFLIDIR